jgi:LytS/YehU family sensor histidine kinase
MLRHKRSTAALRHVELATLRGERRLAELHLAALHAQVEPEFVLTTLDAVERLYWRDVAAADRLLDALIQFLREATPLLRRQSSTIDQECRLLLIYLRVLGAASGLVDDVNVDVERPARDTPLPPGILVSLAQQVLGSLAAGPARFDVRTCRRADSFDLELSATAVSIESGAALRDFTRRARERLRLALGAQGDITLLHDTPGRLTLRITLGKGRGADHGESAKH